MAPVKTKEMSFFLNETRRSSKTFTESDAKAVPVIFATGQPGLEDAAFGFSSEAALESWLLKNGLAGEYAKGKSLLARSPKALTRVQESEASALQAKVAEQHARELEQVLRDARISPDNAEAVLQLAANYPPLSGPPFRSAFLFEHIDSKGQWRYLPKGFSWPNLGWLSFNDVCSSVACLLGGALLFEHSWFKGRGIGMFGYPGIVRNIHTYPFYFNDMASSAITW